MPKTMIILQGSLRSKANLELAGDAGGERGAVPVGVFGGGISFGTNLSCRTVRDCVNERQAKRSGVITPFVLDLARTRGKGIPRPTHSRPPFLMAANMLLLSVLSSTKCRDYLLNGLLESIPT
jgi:hypothetical protein